MKKILFFLVMTMVAVGMGNAQDTNYLQMFPNTEGSQLISKSYDSNNNLQATMVMTVKESYDYVDGTSVEFGFVMTDAMGAAISQGNINARYDNGYFYLDLTNHMLHPMMLENISALTELSGDFLDYPDTFNSDPYSMAGDFQMEAGRISIRDKDNNRSIASVHVYGRSYEGNESVTTPAGTFDASKITFSVDLTRNDVTRTYRGVEWYAVGAGIVRTEIYDNNNNLQDYTVLTSLDVK